MSETFLHGVQVLEVDTGARPIRTVRSSVIGLVGSGRASGVVAGVQIGTGNSKLLFEGVSTGAYANAFTIECVKPSIANASLAVTRTTPTSYRIVLATDGSAVATSTAAQVRAEFNAFVAGLDLECSLGANSNGSGLYAVHAATPLTGGVDEVFPLETPVLITSPTAAVAAVGSTSYLGRAISAIYKQAGAVVVVVRTDFPDGAVDDYTGVYALKRAQADLGYTPRIIVAEGVDAQGYDALKSVCDSCRAIGIVGLSNDTATIATAATAWVAANANERIYTIWPTVNYGEDPAPYVAGVLAKSDNDKGFWWSPSNQEVFGINSLDKPVDFQLGDSTSLANVLNEGRVTTFIRQGGFRVWGNMTGSIDPKWDFLSVRRTADIINDSILQNHLWAVDRNITRNYLEDVSDGVNAYLSTLVNLGAIIGGRCWPDPDLNSPDQIALGKVYFNFEFTPPYPAQTVTFRSILTNDYLSEIID